MTTPSSSQLAAKFTVNSNTDESDKHQEEADDDDVATIDDLLAFGNTGEFIAAEDYIWPSVEERALTSNKTDWIPDYVTKACKHKKKTWYNYDQCWRAVSRMIWKNGKRVKLNETRTKEYCDVLVKKHKFANETQCIKKKRLSLMRDKMMHYYFPGKPPHRPHLTTTSGSSLPLTMGIFGGLFAVAIVGLLIYWFFCKGSKTTTGSSKDSAKAGGGGESVKSGSTKPSATKSNVKSNIKTNAKSKKASQKSGKSKKSTKSKK